MTTFIQANSLKKHEIDGKIQGRALANYQLCSNVATLMADNEMYHYYQSMFNDGTIELLAFSHDEAMLVYKTWSKSEFILAKLDQKTRVQLCASRFDVLTRKLTSNQ